MVECKDIAIQFNGDYLFEDVSFSINFGEKVALLGRNGTGKSTILKMLTGQIKPDEGEISIPDYYRVGFLQQHLVFEKPTVIEEVCSALTLERITEEWKAEKILTGLGFSKELKMQDPKLLSGGYQVKTNLAKLLLSEPDLLILDEPTNYLDIHSIKWLEKFLKEWQTELLVVSHNLSFIKNVTNCTLLLYRKNVIKANNTVDKMKEQIAAEEKNYEARRIAQEKKRKEKQEWIAKWGSKASKATMARSMERQLDKEEVIEKLEHIQDLNFRFKYDDILREDDILLRVEKLNFGYKEGRENLLIKDLSFYLKKKDRVAIIGANGQGKSTLLKLIGGELKQNSGLIDINPKVKFGNFGQTNIDRLDKNLNIYDEVQNANKEERMETVRRICSQMLFSKDKAFKNICELSGGEKSRVMLAKILINKTNFLLLDEPTNHLDIESNQALMDAILEYDGCVMMVTHDEEFLYKIPNKLVVFDNNETYFFDGTYKEFLTKIGFKDMIKE